MSATVRLALLPRDGLFVKDGRGWQTSASGRGHGLEWPWPSTILGALRTAWGRQQEARTGQRFGRDDWLAMAAAIRLGRTLVLRRRPGAAWAPANRVWPAPADAVFVQGEAGPQRLDPAPTGVPTLGRDEDEARDALWAAAPQRPAKPRPAPPRWSETRFAAWLAGDSSSAGAPDAGFALCRRVQVHVGIRSETLTADDGALFSHDIVETLDRDGEWAIGLEAAVPAEHAPALATLGSDGRLAQVETVGAELFDPAPVACGAFRGGARGLRLVVVTPAHFDRGWLPDGLEASGREFRGRLRGLDRDVVLRAAMVGRPAHVSGWDMALRRPKPGARMVPPGSVYFFESTDGRAFVEADARALWLSALGARVDEGFGRVVPGVWTPLGREQ